MIHACVGIWFDEQCCPNFFSVRQFLLLAVICVIDCTIDLLDKDLVHPLLLLAQERFTFECSQILLYNEAHLFSPLKKIESNVTFSRTDNKKHVTYVQTCMLFCVKKGEGSFSIWTYFFSMVDFSCSIVSGCANMDNTFPRTEFIRR